MKRYTGESYGKIKRFLARKEAYTIQTKISKAEDIAYSKDINDLHQTDLVDLTNISRYNDKHRFC